MTEKLLQYLWQFQYFNRTELLTVSGEKVQVNNVGTFNTDEGPDFKNASIKIGNTIWVGNVEIHIKASDWHSHHHTNNKNYQNIILHVVWQNDLDIQEPFETLELHQRVSSLLLKKYNELMDWSNAQFIPCQKQLAFIKPLIWQSWKERLIVERLQDKSKIILQYLTQNNFHWEEVFWWVLAKNFGITVNADAFESIAKSIPISILAKHKNQIHQTEAILFGQAGLLDETFDDEYPTMLQKEFNFYKKKYKLTTPTVQLQFLRMRPSNFPTIRLAQLAMLIHNSSHLFSKIKETNLVKEVVELFDITANDYWHYHYLFQEQSSFKKKHLGKQTIYNIIINTIVPMLFTYGFYHNENAYKNKALQWLDQMPAEKNTITNGFVNIGISNKSAYDSQALIQLKKEFCTKKRCLECAIGNALLKTEV